MAPPCFADPTALGSRIVPRHEALHLVTGHARTALDFALQLSCFLYSEEVRSLPRR